MKTEFVLVAFGNAAGPAKNLGHHSDRNCAADKKERDHERLGLPVIKAFSLPGQSGIAQNLICQSTKTVFLANSLREDEGRHFFPASRDKIRSGLGGQFAWWRREKDWRIVVAGGARPRSDRGADPLFPPTRNPIENPGKMRLHR